MRRAGLAAIPLFLAGCQAGVHLSPERWSDDYERFMEAQLVDRTEAGVATGENGAVTVAYNGLAARAGLEALKQGGNAVDAAMTTALTQVALTAGAPISYFGIMSLVYYDAKTDQVYTMNAEWNTVLGEDDPASIPGGVNLSSPQGIYGTVVSGRTALVGGFMKGVGAAHERFGRLPWEEIFAPAIHVAERGFPISKKMEGYWSGRAADLARLPETKATFLKEDGSAYTEGDVLRQPALAATLRAVAGQGTDYMYGGPWAEKAAAAIQADGGLMTVEDLAAYDVIWDEPLTADLGDGWQIHTNPPPNGGGVAMIEAQRLAATAGLLEEGHWTEAPGALRKALDVTRASLLDFVPPELAASLVGGEFTPAMRVTPEHAERLWNVIETGLPFGNWAEPRPGHSDDVVAIDSDGNIAAITHSINAVLWGKTAIVVDGITIGDPASFQQTQIARLAPGSRLPAPTQTGILFRDGEPVLGFASMGSGLHQRTFQGLLNVMHFGMTVDEAIDTPDFFMPNADPATGQLTFRVPGGQFPREVLDGTGYAYEEIYPEEARFGGEGLWVAIQRDPETGELRAASHNRNNSAAVAW
ncbi:gamma-glutamyltransferase [Candidatus Palauibacter sp.]|uniref:gamma-glutamyltransferase n=1 Tax=Candidatus Palauibacter sp. TaxID=3101350 RepID=UPI003B5A44C0